MTFHDKIGLITKQFKKSVQEKYDVVEIKLFGSSARGDYSSSSDIDILVCLPNVNRNIEEDLFDIAYELELKYDCLIDVIVVPEKTIDAIPLYQNIEKEGVAI